VNNPARHRFLKCATGLIAIILLPALPATAAETTLNTALWNQITYEAGTVCVFGNQHHYSLSMESVPEAKRTHLIETAAVLLRDEKFGLGRWGIFEMAVDGAPLRIRDYLAMVYYELIGNLDVRMLIEYSDNTKAREEKIQALLERPVTEDTLHSP
jgi:hypothetical protein